MPNLKTSWKKLELCIRNKHNWNVMIKNFSSAFCHSSWRVKWQRLACGCKATAGTSHVKCCAYGKHVGLGAKAEFSRRSLWEENRRWNLLPHTCLHCISLLSRAWTQQLTHHPDMAEMPLRISQRLGEFSGDGKPRLVLCSSPPPDKKNQGMRAWISF